MSVSWSSVKYLVKVEWVLDDATKRRLGLKIRYVDDEFVSKFNATVSNRYLNIDGSIAGAVWVKEDGQHLHIIYREPGFKRYMYIIVPKANIQRIVEVVRSVNG